MQSFQEIEYLLFGLSIITLLVGAGMLLKYNFPKVRNADDIYTLLLPWEWVPEKFKDFSFQNLKKLEYYG